MTKIFTLLRHGEVAGDAALYGHTDIHLSEQGRQNVQRAIASVQQQSAIDFIIASPLVRCAQSARELAVQYGLPLQLDEQLKEMHFGDWDGVPFDALAAQWNHLEVFWRNPAGAQPPNGESLENFAVRVIAAWEKYSTAAGEQHCLMLLHAGVIRIIIAHILQLDWRNPALYQQLQINYASSTRIEIATGLPVVKWINLR
ncbi:MAG TPA: histidine phosphatase family protein [Cellvibrio sp.]|nr:histidine phosphatase family protein [Cellvibrio sp.]